MGGLFSKTQYVDLTNKYTSEVKQIEKNIESIQKRKQTQLQWQRSMNRTLFMYGGLLWVFIGITFLLLIDFSAPRRPVAVTNAMRLAPVLLWPFLLFFIKRTIDAFYSAQYKKADALVAKLENQKSAKLEELYNKTDFKRIEELLLSDKKNKFVQRMSGAQAQPGNTPGQHPPHATAAAAGHRGLPSTPAHPNPLVAVSHAAALKTPSHVQSRSMGALPVQGSVGAIAAAAPPAGVPPPAASLRAVAPTRTPMDRVLDFILNDGPSNQYALICSSCFAHNGLVTEQEMRNKRFRCAMCGAFNGKPPTAPEQPSQTAQAAINPTETASAPPLNSASASPRPSSSPAVTAPLSPFPALEDVQEERKARRASAASEVASGDESHEEVASPVTAEESDSEQGTEPERTPRARRRKL